MPKYFFHFRDGQTPLDEKGTELPDIIHARGQAVALAGEMLKNSGLTFCNEGEWNLDVTDHAGLTLFSLCFLAFDAPVVLPPIS